MPWVAGREQVQELMAGGAQLVEVLPAEDFRDRHLKGAVNLPLEELDAAAAARIDRSQAVVVYCYDFQ